MMGGSQNRSQSQEKLPLGISDQQTSSQQQAVPVAYVCGTRKIAVTWLSPVYNLRAVEAPIQTGGKK
jgi:hypothetical protein